ncbi:MAG: TrkH family potassium uptake protein [Blastocatellia bacterium]|nr:TrkH family potassium uptake protein [Blastocatellia bacterium]
MNARKNFRITELYENTLLRLKTVLRRFLAPARLVAVSFAGVILLGTFLLSLPIATRSGDSIPVIDALFTAASATCVTGLVVHDTGTTFSLFGQIVILACIQIGGLGLMTFTTLFLVFAGRRMTIVNRLAILESFHHTPTQQIRTLIKYIVVATCATEALGAGVLTVYWLITDRFATVSETIYQAVFHSISAFCNAGFSLFSDSLTGFQRDTVVQFVMTSLIIAGGLGFLVVLDIRQYIQKALIRRFHRSEPSGVIRPRLGVHTKLVLITTAILLVIGTVSYYFLERRGVFVHLSETEAWMNAYFCSVTPRTAGFNTVDFARMSGASLLCTMVMMFIGAGPGSCGGGIKTSTFAALVAYAFMRWRGHARLHLFNRTIPQVALDRGAAIVIAGISLVIIASSVLMVTETFDSTPGESRREMISILFETISAFGTVGLSLGETPQLSPAGRLVITLVMFMGRIGPLTLALAISRKQGAVQYRYAEENIMVG